MESTTWSTQDQVLATTTDDDFQFLDMGNLGNMGTLGDGLGFDFANFQDGADSSMMHRDGMDTDMGGTEAPNGIPTTTTVDHERIQAMTTSPTHMAISAQMAPPSSNVTDTISEIDAQIRYLQQQRIHQEQRQMQEQRTVFYGNQRHAVPPTPQSMEMPPSSEQFFSPDQSTPMFERYQHLKEQQQEVCRNH
jgi:hypothetical protein